MILQVGNIPKIVEEIPGNPSEITGTSVATYRVSLSGVQQLLSALEGRSEKTGDLGELLANLQLVPAEKVRGAWLRYGIHKGNKRK